MSRVLFDEGGGRVAGWSAAKDGEVGGLGSFRQQQ